jgi:hypothetical protein
VTGKAFRVTILLIILAFAAFNTWFDRYRSTAAGAAEIRWPRP